MRIKRLFLDDLKSDLQIEKYAMVFHIYNENICWEN